MFVTWSRCFLLGTVPIIRCPKGNAAEMVAEVIQPEIIIAYNLSARLMYTILASYRV